MSRLSGIRTKLGGLAKTAEQAVMAPPLVRTFNSVDALQAFAAKHGGKVPIGAGTTLSVALPFKVGSVGTSQADTLRGVFSLKQGRGTVVTLEASVTAPEGFSDSLTLRPPEGSQEAPVVLKLVVQSDWRRVLIDQKIPEAVDFMKDRAEDVQSCFPVGQVQLAK